jgi:hypothetical protein
MTGVTEYWPLELAGSKSPHPGSARYSILMPVPNVPAVQPLRSVQNVELVDATWAKLELLYWNHRRSDKGRGRGRIKAVLVIRERGGENYRAGKG